jgi:hypothetical protein
MSTELSPESWAESEFGSCDLGDARRRKRAVSYAMSAAVKPEASTPDQTDDWGDCKAVYRMFNHSDVTFEALAGPHWERTRAAARGHMLVIDDTMETDFGRGRGELGPTGDGFGRGFFLHSALMVQTDDLHIVGLAGQELFYRKPVPRGQSTAKRKHRKRESEVWGRLVDRVGAPRDGVQYTHVMDRAADNWEVFLHLHLQKCDWVVRSSKPMRKVMHESDCLSLEDALKQGKLLGTYDLDVRAAKDQPARRAKIAVRVTYVTMPAPKCIAPQYRSHRQVVIKHAVIEAQEVDPPKGVKTPIHWVLFTSHSVRTFADALRVLEWYKARWTIEEFHKCLKTGCALEDRQYEAAGALEAVAGMFSVLAVRLLQLKTVARADPDRKAAKMVPPDWLKFLRLVRPKAKIETVRDFVREIAKHGGFLGRKSDGEPGWQTIWRGFQQFQTMFAGAEILRDKCG